MPSSAELLTAALGAAFLKDDVAVTAGVLTVATEADGGRPTERPDDDGFDGCLAAAGCFGAVAARGLSTAGGLSAAGFTAGVLVRSFFGDTGVGSSTLFTGSGAGCTDITPSQYLLTLQNNHVHDICKYPIRRKTGIIMKQK